MIQWQPFTQAARFQRTAWTNAFSVCSAMQLKGKEMLENSLNQCFWLTEKDKEGYLTWAQSCLETTENMQSLIDKSFQEVEIHLPDQSPAASASAKKKSTIASLVLAAAQADPKAASPAEKKTAAKRSTAGSVASPPKKRRAAATKTAKKSVPATETAGSKPQPSAPPAKPAASPNTTAEKTENQAPKNTP